MSSAALARCSSASGFRLSPVSSSETLVSTTSLAAGGLMFQALRGCVPKGAIKPCVFSGDLPSLSHRRALWPHHPILAVHIVLGTLFAYPPHLVHHTQSPEIQRQCALAAVSPWEWTITFPRFPRQRALGRTRLCLVVLGWLHTWNLQRSDSRSHTGVPHFPPMRLIAVFFFLRRPLAVVIDFEGAEDAYPLCPGCDGALSFFEAILRRGVAWKPVHRFPGDHVGQVVADPVDFNYFNSDVGGGCVGFYLS